jgi:hypothetical protein
MIKYLLCVLVVVMIFLVVNQAITKKSEGFQSMGASVDFTHPDFVFRRQASITDEGSVGSASPEESSKDTSGQHSSGAPSNDYVLKSDIERAARASAMKYCPVPPEYNPADYIKKSAIDLERTCPKLPDLKDYVLKSTIPPVQKCPACVCPKVKVSAGMCKECPTPKNNCPPCKPCGVEECVGVIKCASNEKPVSCPKCPPPQPCPQPPEKVCPSFELPTSDIKCPAPKPCPLPESCPDGQGRCPELPESKCKYYGIKEVVKERSVNDIVNELLLSDDPELQEVLESLKSKLDINLAPAPTKLVTEAAVVSTTSAGSPPTTSQMDLSPTTSQMDLRPTTTPMPAPNNNSLLPAATTQAAQEFKPEAVNNANHQYEFNTYKYSSLNNLNHMNDPLPAYNGRIKNTPLNGANNLGCDINDGNCSYNTNLNI